MNIIVKSLSYIHPDRNLLFSNINFSVSKDRKVSLVGHNGIGKSTLLRIIAGMLHPSKGEVSLSSKPYYVPQHVGQYDNYTIAQALAIEKKVKALHAILAGETSPENFTMLEDDWNIEEKVKAALSFWGIGQVQLFQPMSRLSGGEKTKIFLSGISIHSPEIILLDEPTNHLDTKSRIALYDFINKNKSTMMAVSHDRTLLNLFDTTLELTGNSVDVFGGNYTFYKQEKERELETLQSQLNATENTLRLAKEKAREMAGQRQKQEIRGKAQGEKNYYRVL